MSHRRPLQLQPPNTTRLCLTLRGIAGTHGSQDEHGDTGSAGSVRHWIHALNSLGDLRHLELQDATEAGSDLQFSDMENSDPLACILDWILPNLSLKHLRTLRLCKFLFDTATTQTTFAGKWPCLEKIELEDASLMLREEEGIDFEDSHVEHLQGVAWLDTCRMLIEKNGVPRIALVRPASNVNNISNYSLHSKYAKLLRELPQVDLEVVESHTFQGSAKK